MLNQTHERERSNRVKFMDEHMENYDLEVNYHLKKSFKSQFIESNKFIAELSITSQAAK